MFVRDLIERAAKTAAQTFLAAFAGGSVFEWNVSAVRAAALAAAAAALSVVSSWLSERFGTRGTASLVR